LWVILDEFNTTVEVQILVDLIITKKYNGYVFNENFIFIGLCNPYQYVDLSDYKIGLKKNKKILKQFLQHDVQLFPERAI